MNIDATQYRAKVGKIGLLIGLLVALILGYVILSYGFPTKSSSVVISHPVLVFNPHSTRETVGFADSIFVGRVIRRIGTVEMGVRIPGTEFGVQVIESLKGNVSGTVSIVQHGGYRDGRLFIMESSDVARDVALDPEVVSESYFLKPDRIYLFVARYDDENHRHVLISHPRGRVPIGEEGVSEAELLQKVRSNQDVAALREEVERQAADPVTPTIR